MWSWKQWRRMRILGKNVVPAEQWQQAEEALGTLEGLTGEETRRLRELAVLFLHEKSLEPVQNANLDESMRLRLALQACLPILNLGLDWYDGWVSVIIYPAEFITEHESVDEAGVVHRLREPRSGESWLHGPVILSLSDIKDRFQWDGHSVVIHEFAHKLDMLNGDANGLPPLHPQMNIQTWSEVFTHAYEDLCRRVAQDEATFIDPYASESPGEFFAVVSEVFFEAPNKLLEAYPAVYEQLKQFYRQDPYARLMVALNRFHAWCHRSSNDPSLPPATDR